jgi:hypothetical protein
MINYCTSFAEPTTAFLAGISSAIARGFRNIVTRRYAARLMSLFTLLILELTPGPAHASRPYDDSHAAPTQQLTSIAVAPNGGFWVLRDKFEITGFGGQQRSLTKQDGELASVWGAPITWPAYYAGSIAAIPGRNAYWIVSIRSDGQVNGYWLVGEDGGVHAMGGTLFWGSTGRNDGGSPVTNIVSFPAPVPGQSPQATKADRCFDTGSNLRAEVLTVWPTRN